MKKVGVYLFALVQAFAFCSASFAESMPGYHKGRCRILRPGTADRGKNYYCDKGYAITYDGYIARAQAPCNSTLEVAAKELEASEFCMSLPAMSGCSLQYPNVTNASGRYCEKGYWSYTTFDGLELEDSCYESVARAFAQMQSSPACTQGSTQLQPEN